MKVEYITVHVSATKLSNPTSVADIDNWHRARGWNGIGYHWYINQAGEVHAGRFESMQGAHVAGHNWRNLGICLEGGLDEGGKPAFTMNEAQADALKLLLKQSIGRHGVKWKNIRGHRDWGANKACPCFDVQEWLRQEFEL